MKKRYCLMEAVFKNAWSISLFESFFRTLLTCFQSWMSYFSDVVCTTVYSMNMSISLRGRDDFCCWITLLVCWGMNGDHSYTYWSNPNLEKIQILPAGQMLLWCLTAAHVHGNNLCPPSKREKPEKLLPGGAVVPLAPAWVWYKSRLLWK